MFVEVLVGGLKIAGTESELAAQVEAQVHVCVVVGERTADSRHGKHRCRR